MNNQNKYPSLRGLLTKRLILWVLVPFLVAFLILEGYVEREVKKNILLRNGEIVNLLKVEIESFFKDIERKLDSISDQAKEAKDPDLFLKRFVQVHLEYDEVLVTDLKGKIIHSSNPERNKGFDFSRRSHFLLALHTNSVVYSTPFVSLSSGRMAMAMSKRVANTVVIFYVNLTHIAKLLDRIKEKSAIVELVDSNGVVIQDSTGEEGGQRLNLLNRDYIAEALKNKKDTHLVVRERGKGKYWIQMRILPMTGLLLVYKDPMSVLFTSRHLLFQFFVILWLVLLGIIVVVIYRSVQSIVLGLQEMSNQTESVIKGFYQVVDMGNIHYRELLPLQENIVLMSSTIEVREAQLREKAQFYQNLIDNIPNPVFYRGMDGTYLGCNRAYEEYIGKSLDELLVHHYLSFVSEDEKKCLELIQKELLSSEQNQRFELSRLSPEGDMQYFLFYQSIYRDLKGRKIGILATMVNITKIKKSQKQLQQALDKLKLANKELQEFTYVASHDLQEPLRMVTGFMSLLEEEYSERLDKDAREYISFAVDGAIRMRDLIQSLLKYSGVGSRELEIEDVSLDKAIKDAQKNLSSLLKEHHVEVRVFPLPNVKADYQMMVQLFQNLIANAVKYNLSPKPEVEIKAEDRGEEWEFSVIDNGMGIDPGKVEQIFKVFKRLHRDKEEGSGIGLSVVSKIIARHGGRIAVKERPGGGSIFFFTLPKKIEEKVDHEENFND